MHVSLKHFRPLFSSDSVQMFHCATIARCDHNMTIEIFQNNVFAVEEDREI